MATAKVLSLSQNCGFNLSGRCWNLQQRNISSQRMILELLGNIRPKKPSTAFLKFASDHRRKVIEQHPDKKFGDIMKLLSNLWTELPMSEKQKYINIYKEEQKIYFEKIKKFEDSFAGLDKKKIVEKLTDLKNSELPNVNSVIKNILQKTLNKPKSPKTPYFKYVTHVMAQDQEKKLNSKILSNQWKNLPEEEKKKYKEEFNKEWEQYQKELGKWEQEMIQEGHVDIVRLKTLKELINKTT